MCGMNFINLIRIRSIFGIEDQLILSYNPHISAYGSFSILNQTYRHGQTKIGQKLRHIHVQLHIIKEEFRNVMKIRFHTVIKHIFQIVRHPACLMEKRLDIIHALFRFQTGCFQQLSARNFSKPKYDASDKTIRRIL